MNVSKKYVFWIIFFAIQGFRPYHAETDDGYYYSVEYEPLNHTPQNDEQYPGGRTGEVNEDAGGGIKEPDTDHSCHHAMDLALVFDSSYTITSDGWSKIKEAAKTLTDNLDVSPYGTHVSMLVYSTNVDDYYMFDGNSNTGKISKLIDGLTYYGEWSRLDRALSALPHHVFSPFNGARSDVPKAVVVFTDGKIEGPSTVAGNKEDLFKSLARSVDNLRRENIVIYGVATGASNDQVFDVIAGDRSRIFNIDDIGQLIKSLLHISVSICKGNKEEEVKKYVSSSAAVESPATLTATINVTVTVTASESLLPTSPLHSITSSQAIQGSKSTMASLPSQLPSSVGLSRASESLSSSTAATSLTLTVTLSPNQLGATALTPTPTVSLSHTTPALGSSIDTITAAAGGSIFLSPSQTASATGTGKTSSPLSTTPSIQGSSTSEANMTGASLSSTPSNQPTTSLQSPTSVESLSPTTSASLSAKTSSNTGASPTETATVGKSSSLASPSNQLLSATKPSTTSTPLVQTLSTPTTSADSATVGKTISPSSSSVITSPIGTSTASAVLATTPSTQSTSSTESATASESMSSQPISPSAVSLASESLSAIPSSTETATTVGSSSTIQSNQPAIASVGTVATTVTVTVTPTPKILASPTRTSASGSTPYHDEMQDVQNYVVRN